MLKNNFYNQMFEESQLDKLFKCFTKKHYKNGEIVYNKEKSIKKIVVIFYFRGYPI